MKINCDNELYTNREEEEEEEGDDGRNWKEDIDDKNRRIMDLEREVMELENFLKDHSDTNGIIELKRQIDQRNNRIEELEDTIAEFEDFLKHNPDVKDLHDLKTDINIKNRIIQELENKLQKNEDKDLRINKPRIMELEEMVTHLEDYVKQHNVDVLKQKLKDREDRIEQLQTTVNSLEKQLLVTEETTYDKVFGTKDNRITEMERGISDKIKGAFQSTEKSASPYCHNCFEAEKKLKEMERLVAAKDNNIHEYEDEISQWQDKLFSLQKQMAELEKELGEYEAEDIGVLKEEIKVRDERIGQLEDEIDSLERAFGEQMDMEQIEELVNVVRQKEEGEKEMKEMMKSKQEKIEELSAALRESVVIASEGERQLRQEETKKRTCMQRVSKLLLSKILENFIIDIPSMFQIEKLEQRIASLQTSFAVKCPTCKPLLSRLQKSEKKLYSLTEERTTQLEELHNMK